MSLVGKLEDLGLGEILQIVALSGKSGILHVKSQSRVGKIFFFKGKVVSASSDAYRINLGEFLIRKGITTPELIKKALEKQKDLNFSEKLGSILIRDFGISRDNIEECVTDLIEKSVFSLFYWTEGEFRFELTDTIQNEEISVDLLQYDLSQNRGLNPQFLAMEGTRILDERRKDGTAAKECFIESAAPQEACPPQAAPAAAPEPQIVSEAVPAAKPAAVPTILLVDDFYLFRNVVKRYMEEKRYKTETAESVAEARKKLDEMIKGNGSVILVTALILPGSGEQGVLGGLELIQSIAPSLNIPIVVTCDYSVPDAEEALKTRNVMFLKKPKKSTLTKENVKQELEFFIRTLEKSVSEFTASRPAAEPEKSSRWDKEIKEEFQIKDGIKTDIATTPGLTLLKSMISELAQAESGNEIILMLLRLASEIMPRGVIFAIKPNQLFGLGQFGLEKFIPQPMKVVKGLTLNIKGKVEEVIETGYPYRGEPPGDEIFELLFQKLGGGKPTEIFLSTISSGNKPLVLFYGDNLPEKTAIRDTDALEIFFTQAGLAMERLLLEKKVKGEQE